jgi:hypothetical protein
VVWGYAIIMEAIRDTYISSNSTVVDISSSESINIKYISHYSFTHKSDYDLFVVRFWAKESSYQDDGIYKKLIDLVSDKKFISISIEVYGKRIIYALGNADKVKNSFIACEPSNFEFTVKLDKKSITIGYEE